MTMRRLALLIVALSVMLAAPSSAAEKLKMTDHFELWNDCQSVGLLVERLNDNAAKIGLRVKDIETTVRSRLRGARIYSERGSDARAFLYANVHVTEYAVGIDLRLKRLVKVLFTNNPVEDIFTKKPVETKFPLGEVLSINNAATWERGSTGTHGGSSGNILSVLAKHTDEFIDEYLRVNREACEKRPPVR